MDVLNKNDIIVQMVRCSFDTHVQDIMGALMVGATLVMLHPRGNLDFDYLSCVLGRKQVTCMTTVPSLLHRFFTFLKETNNSNAGKSLRSLCSGGM